MLEDEFIDVIGKAKRGTGADDARLARAVGVSSAEVRAWTSGERAPDEAQVRALAAALGLDPAKLADAAAARFAPQVPSPPGVVVRSQQPQPANGYLLLADDDAALVDCAGDPRRIVEAVRATGRRLRYVLVTHEHADHCDAAGPTARAFPEARFVMHAADAHALGPLAAQALLARDGETLAFGAGEIRVVHAPGHTDGSLCFLANGAVATGDALFAGSVGRVFARTATYADLLRSGRALLALDPATVVLPGHGPLSTIALERAHNPFFAAVAQPVGGVRLP